MSLPRVVAAAFCTLACVGVASADISKPFDGVSDLTTRNFKRSVLNGKHWFVEFYAPWCGWCKKLEPEWRTLGRSVGDKHPSVAIGKVNADNDASDITDKYDVKGFPTIVFIRPGGQWKKYSGARTASAFLEYINREAGTDLAVEVKDEEKFVGGTGVVQKLTGANWQNVLLSAQHDVMIKFYAPWCSHCKSMESEWIQLAKDVASKNDVIVAELDTERFRDAGNKLKIGSFPTIKLFTKRNKKGIDFSGPRVSRAFGDFLTTHTTPPKKQ